MISLLLSTVQNQMNIERKTKSICHQTVKKQSYTTEGRIRQVIEEYFGVNFEKVRLDIMKNKKSKRNLELDMYNPLLKIAFEYNGIQHYQFRPKFHKNNLEFQEQIERDKIKKDLCKRNKIQLIIISHKEINNMMTDKQIIEVVLKKLMSSLT